MNLLVSIVVCSYNRLEYISECLDSILNQQCNFQIEIIIGDDVSSDGTRDILIEYQKKYPDIVRPILHEVNLGTGRNWARTMKNVKGKYVALCDDDDYWHDATKLQQQVDLLESRNDIGLVHTDYRTLDIFTGKMIEKQVRNQAEDNLLTDLFRGNYFLLTSSTMFRAELIDNYVSLDDYITYDFPIQDWNTWMLIAGYTRFYHLPVSTVTYRISSNSMSRPGDYATVEKKYAREKVMYKYICDKFADQLPFDESGYDSYVNSILLGLAYRKADFAQAHSYGSKIPVKDSKNLKVSFSKSRISFYLYCMVMKLKSKI